MIRNIWAVGRNYLNHAKEMKAAVPSQPLFFLKAGSGATFSNEIILPPWIQEVHHEIEIAFQFDKSLQLQNCGLALDLTERNIQSLAKAKGEPWTLAKSFIASCPLTRFISCSEIPNWVEMEFSLSVNGTIRQTGKAKEMIFPIETLTEFAKTHFPVCPNDLLLTGTPEGVGPIRRGDLVEARWGQMLQHQWLVK